MNEVISNQTYTSEIVPYDVLKSEYVKIAEKYPILSDHIQALLILHGRNPLPSEEALAILIYSLWADNPESLRVISFILGVSENTGKKYLDKVAQLYSDSYSRFDEILEGYREGEENKPYDKKGVVVFERKNNRFEIIEKCEQSIYDLRDKGLNNEEIAGKLGISLWLVSYITQPRRRKPSTVTFDSQVKKLVELGLSQQEIKIRLGLHISIPKVNSAFIRLRERGELPKIGLSSTEQEDLEKHVHQLKTQGYTTRIILLDILTTYNFSGTLNLSQLSKICGTSRQNIHVILTSLKKDGFPVPHWVRKPKLVAKKGDIKNG